MKNKRIFKTFSALCAALVLMMGLSVTAFAKTLFILFIFFYPLEIYLASF